MIKKIDSNDIVVSLDSYKEMFSYFDPRSYPQRSMSHDLLAELKRAAKDKKLGVIDLKFVIHKSKRTKKKDIMIKKRLKEHFIQHDDILKKERNKYIKRGIIYALIGVILMLLATTLLFYTDQKTFFNQFLIVLLEPGGWFLFWEGLYLVIFDSKYRTLDLEFYKKMQKCRVIFL